MTSVLRVRGPRRAAAAWYFVAAITGTACTLPDVKVQGARAPSRGASDAGEPRVGDSGGTQDSGRLATNRQAGDAVKAERAEPAPKDDAPDAGAAASAEKRRCAPIDKLDLLLMVDNSNSMAGEQASLKRAFPGMLEALTSGERYPDDSSPFPPVKDVHVGVVSSDMGTPGVELPPSCNASGGDDGKLQHLPHGLGCESSYPRWLSFAARDGATVDQLVDDLACIAGLGTGGCGFEQQLEAPFKALWPKRFRGADGAEIMPNPYRFLANTEAGTWGRGDAPAAEGGNDGFLRPSTDASPSLVVVVVVSDEDDCSVRDTEHLRPNNQLPADSPYRAQDINLRCLLNTQFNYDIKARYYEGFRQLRPSTPDRVMFAAIVGVPPELASSDALAKVDFDTTDPRSRQAFFDAILSDDQMKIEIDPSTMPGNGQGNIRPSCSRTSSLDNQLSTAFPPRRIVQLAKLFDRNGLVQSICQDDFTQPSLAIVDMIARRLQSPCAPER